jgi:pyridoxine 4-dehydrogenase
LNIGFIPWSPLAAGNLAAPRGALDRAAAQFRVTTSQLALAWLLWRSPVILPIPGTSRVQHLEENIAAASVNLDEAKLRELGQAIRATHPSEE